MSYTVLGDYLATKDKATVEQGFRQYIAIYGTDNIGNEAWPTYSFALLGKSEPMQLFRGGELLIWSIDIDFLHGMFNVSRTSERQLGTWATYVSYWYQIDNHPQVYGQDEYLSDPIDIKAWFNKHFSNFVKQYIQHEQDV